MAGCDDRLLDEVAGRVEALAGLSVAQLIRELRTVVIDLMLAIHPDGSWFGAEVVQEALAIVLGVADQAMVDEGLAFDDLDADDRRWLDACHSSVRSLQLLDDMLDDLRRSIRQPGPNAGERW